MLNFAYGMLNCVCSVMEAGECSGGHCTWTAIADTNCRKALSKSIYKQLIALMNIPTGIRPARPDKCLLLRLHNIPRPSPQEPGCSCPQHCPELCYKPILSAMGGKRRQFPLFMLQPLAYLKVISVSSGQDP